MNRLRKRRGKKGFTLVEMMIVVAIAIIMAGIGIPAMMKYMPTIRLNGAARQVLGHLMATRMKAVKEVTTASLVFEGSTQYKIWVDSNRDGAEDTDEVTYYDLADSFISVHASATTPIEFNSRASCNTYGDIVLSNTRGSRKVSTNLAGMVKIIKISS